MAWCQHCEEDRPIRRHSFTGKCPHCEQPHDTKHLSGCRGPVTGQLDVCTFCDSPLFAKAKTKEQYKEKEEKEKSDKNEGCFVVTATLGDAGHPVVRSLRHFRDDILITFASGRAFIRWYDRHGPGLAAVIKSCPGIRPFCYVLIVLPAYFAVRLLSMLPVLRNCKNRSSNRRSH